MGTQGVDFQTKTNIDRKGIEPTQVKSITLLTKLDLGSANEDGEENKTKTQYGMIYGKTYKFKVASYTNLPPQDKKKIKWKYKYHSLSQNKWIEHYSKVTGEEYSIYMNEKDICGRTLHVMAYINDPDSEGYNKIWVHNRFRWFNRTIVINQAEERAKEPWKIKQGGSSLCGMAALYYALIKHDSERYLKITKELFRTGECKIGSYSISPHSEAHEMYDTNPQKSQDYINMSMFAVDWIVLAVTRSKESSSNLIYKGKESGRTDMLKAVNWPNMLARMGNDVAGFTNSKAIGLSYNSINNKKRLISGRLHDYFSNSDLEELIEIDKKYKNGKNILMMIDADMIYNKSSYSSLVDVFNDSHWVVYEGGLVFFDSNKNVTSDLDKVDYVSFKIFTWGRNPSSGEYFTISETKAIDKDVKNMSTTPGLNVKSFKSNFYGYIEMY